MLRRYRLFATTVGLALIATLGFASLSNTAAITASLQPTLPSRDELISTIFDPTPQFFTASGEQIIFDPDKLIFLSKRGGTFAFVPLHAAYQPRLRELYKAWQEFENVAVPLGGLYIVEPIKIKGMYNEGPEFSLPKGAYLIRVEPVNPKGDILRVAIVNEEGEVMGYIDGDIHLVTQPQPLKSRPFIRTKQVSASMMLVEIEIPWLMPSTDNAMSLDSFGLGPIRDFLEGVGWALVIAASIAVLI
ncbi:MAG: hypothetical protein RMJ29_08585 [Candidatus Bipolaricaulota bacterium]|nr:hypothetical protein [Candidatus Bipolaricaulota bacterium]